MASVNTVPQFPGWILLDKEAYIDDAVNDTTAATDTRSGIFIRVSLFAADPPRLSHFSVYCSGMSKNHYIGCPRVLDTVDNCALISVTFIYGSKTEYFLYEIYGGLRKLPTIRLLDEVGCYLSKVRLLASISLLSCGDGGDLVLAALVRFQDEYELHVRRLSQLTWTSKVLRMGPGMLTIQKVLRLGGGELGFVDLKKGILVCDVLKESSAVRFIPLPKPLPDNRSNFRFDNARQFRDVIFCADDSTIRCVEVEAWSRRVFHERPQIPNRQLIQGQMCDDPSNRDVLDDSDLISDIVADAKAEVGDHNEKEYKDEYLGWRVISWRRVLSSSCWRKEALVHVDDIHVNPEHAALLADLGGNNPELVLKNLYAYVPSVSLDDSNILYLISTVKPTDEKLFVLMVDMGKRTLEQISPLFTKRRHLFLPMCHTCTLPNYLNMDRVAMA